MQFWFKLGLLLFDSSNYDEAFTAFNYAAELADSELYKFAAYTWLGHLKDLQQAREAAIGFYQEALKHDTGSSMQHSQYRMILNKEWVEQRLQTPFTGK